MASGPLIAHDGQKSERGALRTSPIGERTIPHSSDNTRLPNGPSALEVVRAQLRFSRRESCFLFFTSSMCRSHLENRSFDRSLF